MILYIMILFVNISLIKYKLKSPYSVNGLLLMSFIPLIQGVALIVILNDIVLNKYK